MLKTLLKKQMLEINRSFFYDARKGRNRTKKGVILYVSFYILLMVGYLGVLFGFLAHALAAPLVEVGMGWLYFLIMGGIAVVLGIFGSVFSTYSSLYMSKDNDLLLSMPIPIRYILISRLMGVFLTGLMYSAVVLIPTFIMYVIAAPFSVGSIVGPLVFSIDVVLLVFILSVALGWVVAKISAKMKNKSLMTTIIALIGLGLYYVVYFKLYGTIQQFIMNIQQADIDVSGAMSILYNIGLVGCGKAVPMLAVTAAVILVLVGVYVLLSKTFIKIVTTKTGVAKIKYKETKAKQRGIGKALLFKEMKRITSSSTIMLNCLLSCLIMVVAAVALLIKGGNLYALFSANVPAILDALPLYLFGAIATLASMIYLTSFSVSLEGSSIWILKTLPVSSMQILSIKRWTNVLLSAPVSLLMLLSAAIVMHMAVADTLIVVLLTVMACFIQADFGLFLDLKRTNLHWTSETALVKQGLNPFLDMLLGWVEAGLIIVSGIFLAPAIGTRIVLFIWVAFLAIILVLEELWLRKKGTVVFENL
jgi:ABC-2 type transport system permease protein